jgi:hypothetical protein
MKEDALWTRITEADPGKRRVLISLKPATKDRGFFHGTSLMSSSAFKNEKVRLLNSIPGLRGSDYRPIELANGTQLPVFAAEVGSKTTLEKLQESQSVDYVEPQVILFDSLACGDDPYQESSDTRAKDQPLSGPYPGQDRIPYTYGYHHVQEAWERFGNYPGENQGIAVLDTGISDDQQQFFSQYAAYYDRSSLLRLNETDASINDECSHGTKSASVAAAPRDGRSIVGIAWRAPLTTVKIVRSPLAEHGEVSAICRGIADAVSPSDGRPPARAVSMAFGLSYYSPTIAECIASAFRTSPNTVFVAAAGSTVTEVVFPANLNDYVTAVSMVELSPNSNGYRLMGRPLTVAYGPSVDFVSAMAPTKMPASGMIGNDRVDEITTFGQSSAATGMYTGLVALASQYAEAEGWTREQLMTALKIASSKENITDFSGEPVQAVIGAGILDAYRATGGARKAVIKAPYQVKPDETVTLEAETDAVVPPGATPPDHFKYRWTVNDVRKGTGRIKTIQAPSSGPMRIELTVRDSVDKRSLFASHQIEIVPQVPEPERKRLYWSSYVADWSTFGNGGRHDRWVNVDESMPEGCVVEGVLGLLMDKIDGQIRPARGYETPQVSVNQGSVGFTVSRPEGIRPNRLQALVHQWHNGFNIVRTKVVYDVLQPPGVDCADTNGVLTTSP